MYDHFSLAKNFASHGTLMSSFGEIYSVDRM